MRQKTVPLHGNLFGFVPLVGYRTDRRAGTQHLLGSRVLLSSDRFGGRCMRFGRVAPRERLRISWSMDLDGDSDQQKDNRPAASEATSAEAQGGASGDEKNEARVEGDRQAEEEVHLSHEGHVEDEESAEGEDLLNSPPFLKRKIEILEKELQSLREELQAARHAADSERDSVLRLAAEFDNFRRRVAREKQQEELRGRMRAVQMLLPAIDNFDRAAQSLKPQHEEALKIQQSYQVLCKQVLDAFSKMGVETVDPLGTQFDPKLHEAIQRVESTEHPDGVVTQVFQKGYFLRDASTAQSSGDGSSEGILIRAAVCAVSIGPGPSSPESSSSAKSAASSAEGQSHDEDAASSLNDESSE